MPNNGRISANELNLRYAIPVGEFIKDEMSFRGVSQTEMALMMGIELPKFNKILNGTQRLTADVALKIEEVWGIPAHIYMDLQSQYEIDKEKIAEDEDFCKFTFEMEGDLQYASQYSFNKVNNFNTTDNSYKTAA